jgi:uncharacterized membrane protein YedE/YeeE
MAHTSLFVAGLLFAVGLVVGGMTQPAKIVGFLDFAGDWDPSLAFVMVGAIGVHGVAYRLVTKRATPLFAPKFLVPTRRDIDVSLVAGAALFGVGWGLGGFCPGPAITSLGAGAANAVLFVAALLAGHWTFAAYSRIKAAIAIRASRRAGVGAES